VRQSKVAFIRFVSATRHPDSGVEIGLFELAYSLLETAGADLEHRKALLGGLAWFEKHLPTPDRFNRSKSKGYYRRSTKGIAWFRDSATECISRMYELKRLLDANGYLISTIRESRVGYIVYEDDLQVIAEPFAETRTGD
jgi:hypothetical protein